MTGVIVKHVSPRLVRIEAMRVPVDGPGGARDFAAWGALMGWFAGHDFTDFFITDDLGVDLMKVVPSAASHARPGDWIICTSPGMFHALSADVFALVVPRV